MANGTQISTNEDFSNIPELSGMRWYVTRFVKKVAESVPAGTLLLDAGAGECAYKHFFKHCRYYASDLAVGDGAWNYRNLDAISRLDRISFRDSSFDAVLCTQVLEHLDAPQESVNEFYRILKKNGKIFITAPMSQFEHQQPYDFFRYTSFGLKSILEKTGFRNIRVEPFGGLFVKLAYELPRINSIFPNSGLRSGRVYPKGLFWLPLKMSNAVLIRALQSLFLRLDRFDKAKIDTIGWSVTAEK